jgi:hypothetical protein
MDHASLLRVREPPLLPFHQGLLAIAATHTLTFLFLVGKTARQEKSLMKFGYFDPTTVRPIEAIFDGRVTVMEF